MQIAPLPKNEQERLQALYRYQILDSDFEKEFDDLVKLASYICGTSISLVSLVSSDKQWFKAKVGLEARETPRDLAFCAHAILDDDVMIVPDAKEDERFFDNPLVTEAPDIRFYAGMPLRTPDGLNIGTLCVIDQSPKDLTPEQQEALRTLAAQVIAQLELRIRVRELNAEKKQIAHKNEQINASLRYAQRIQKALMPDTDWAENYFEKGFILNMPLQRLGGDFYWLARFGSEALVILADCTGHGVPGALMSMLGYNILDTIIYDRKVIQPAAILNHLDADIQKSLHQETNQNVDGMDASVVLLNFEEKSFTFAGANQKAIYIDQEGTHTLAGERYGLGGKTDQRKLFSEVKRNFMDKPAPMIYCFSDGYQDQFGGEKKQRFYFKRLVSLLEEVHAKPARQQKKALAETHKQWREAGQESQTDDILVLGFQPKWV